MARHTPGTPITRRSFLRFAAAASGAGVAALLAACGAGSTPTVAPAASSSAKASTAPSVAASASAGAATSASAAASSPASTAASASAATSAAPVASASGPAPKRGGQLKVGLTSDTGTLDPLTSSFLVDREVFYNMYDSLVAIDKDLKIVPSLAEKWELPDPKTYIFTLRKDVKFHDGTEFDSAAVKFNLDRYLTDTTSRRKSEIDTIQTVEAVDKYTVKLTLKAAFAPLLANLVDRAGMMLSPKAIQAGGADFARKPVGAGTGAFKFVEWVKDDHITLEKNPTYWKKGADGNALPYLDKLTYRPITDETVRLTNLKTGDLDADFNIPAKDYGATKTGSELVLKETSALSFNSIYFNTSKEPFNKKEYRQAISFLIDRALIAKTVFFDVQKVGYGPIPPSSWAYDKDFAPYKVDVAKAKELLKTAGKPEGFAFEMKITAGSPTTLQLTQLVKDMLAQAGITMNIVQQDAAKLGTDTQAGNFEAAYYGWSGRIDPDGNIYNQMRGMGSLNESRYDNAQVNDLLDKARASSDQNERKGLYQQAQKLIVDDAPFVFYSFGTALLVTRPNVLGVDVWADQIMRFEQASLK